jgi:aspartate 1-decarboxylase
MRWVMRSKIHNATVTEANLAYVGSITIDEDLLDAVGLWPGERVLVVSNTSGARLETYVIRGPRGLGDMCVNGAAAHLIGEGEEIIVMGFELTDKPLPPKAALVDRRNAFVRYLAETPATTLEPFPSLA